MRKLLTSLLVLALTGGVAVADTYIGLFADGQASHCYAPTAAYTTTRVHVIAWLDASWVGQISACEFYVENYPLDGPGGIVTPVWSTPLVIGYVNYGIALAFPNPLNGPLAYLGRMDFYCIDPAWLGDNYALAVRPSRQSDTLALVNTLGETIPVAGGQFTFNCTNPSACDCLESVATADMSISNVKALY
ncbi:hypothetical protein FJ251_13450 [bacterium]|nr:hypothetical protein [bacterium]